MRNKQDNEDNAALDGYAEQRERIVQLLKDHPNPYATNISCNPSAVDYQPTPDIPKDEVSDGHWNMTPEMERQIRRLKKNDVYVRSRQLLEEHLDHMKTSSIYHYALRVVFLGDSAEYWAYERLTTRAMHQKKEHAKRKKKLEKRLNSVARQRMKEGWSTKTIVIDALKAHADLRDQYPDIRLYDDLEAAIHELTLRMYDIHLEVLRPTKAAATNGRRISMEEKYREIYRVFASHCEDIAKTSKKYRNKAYKETVLSCNETRSTVERAVHFVEAGEPEEAQSRRRTVKKTATQRCQTYDTTTVRSHKKAIKKEKP